MILDDIWSLIEETTIKKEIEHYKKLRHVPGKIIDDPKLAVKITKNMATDIIKNSPSIATGFATGINPKGTIIAIKEIRKKKGKLLKHPIDTAYVIHGTMGSGWEQLAKTAVDSTIRSTN